MILKEPFAQHRQIAKSDALLLDLVGPSRSRAVPISPMLFLLPLVLRTCHTPRQVHDLQDAADGSIL